MRTTFFSLLLTLCAATAAADAPHRFERYDLGSAAGGRLTADVRVPSARQFAQVTVTFTITAPDGSVTSYPQDINLSTADQTLVVAADFVGLGRKQIFVSAAHGAVANELLDCDGKQVVTIYRDEGSRVKARPVKRGKTWLIQEDWPRSQWDDTGEMGTGLQLPLNMIRRTLRWDGTKFVPQKPGPSKIISK